PSGIRLPIFTHRETPESSGVASQEPSNYRGFGGPYWSRVMPITASILYDLICCPHRVALDAFGDPALRDKTNPFVRLLWERGTLYEREVIAKLNEPFLDLSHLEIREKEQQTLQAIARGEPLIYGGRLSADDLLGMPDLLRKVPGGYIP